jgi:pimeloyl-ACP methyl ester carboxylesterase
MAVSLAPWSSGLLYGLRGFGQTILSSGCSRRGRDLARVKESLREPANLAAAIGNYRAARAAGGSGGSPGAAGGPPETAARYAAEEQAAGRQAPLPTLYVHGAADGCIRVELARGAERLLAPSSRMVVIENAGHFLHLENPARSTSTSSPGSAASAFDAWPYR